jgi:transglutaminase-like putative cysteine protease
VKIRPLTSFAESSVPAPTAADWLVGAALLVVAPLIRELPFWVSGGYIAAVAWRFLHTHWHWPQPGRWLRWVLAVTAVIAVQRYFGTLLGREPGVSLLVLLTGLKLLELRSLRDAALAAMLLLLIILGTFLYDNSLLLGLYTLAGVVAVTAAFVRLQQPALAPVAVARLAAVLVAQALPLMLVAYLLFPRLPDAVWALQTSEATGIMGMPDEMRPGNISALNTSDEPAFRAYFEKSVPPNSELYWRVRVFWDSDGRAWQEGPTFTSPSVLRAPQNSVSYRVVVEPNDKPWLPVLDLPLGAPSTVQVRAGFIYEAPRLRRERQTYDFVSYTRYRTGALDGIERRRALALPVSISERVRRLAGTWRAGSRNDADIVRSALAHFNTESFVYTLTPPRLGRDPVDEFLFETRRGYCEHYAAAFVTLMRATGVPARVVVGYQGGIYNPAGNYLIVRQSDAHAWAEVWLNEVGWARVDPTAAVAPSRIEYGIDGMRRLNSQGLPLNAAADAVLRAIQLPWLDRTWLRTRLAWDYVNFSWYLWVGDYTLERQAQFLARIGLTDWSVPAMVAILVQLVLLYALLQLRRRRPRDAVLHLYEKYCRKLARAGIARADAEGPVALSVRARTERQDWAAVIDEITSLYVALRYGRAAGAAELRSFARAVRAFRPRA